MVQASLPAVALNWPAAHVAHVRSLESVGAWSRYWPAAHGALTAVHALPSSVAENVDPSTHALHTRSATAEPACDSPWPAAHVCHATQAWLPGAALNMPLAHGAHSRSDEAPKVAVSYSPGAHTVMAWHTRSAAPVGAANVNCPLGHTARCVTQSRSDAVVGAFFSNSLLVHSVTGAHARPLLAPDHVAPATHGAHSRSAVAVGAFDWPKPTAHVRHAVHLALPALLLNWPAGHTSHVRSAETVATVLIASPAPHGLLTAMQLAPLSTGENVAPTSHGAQRRSAVAEPACDMPKPALHVCHALHCVLATLLLNWPCAQRAHVRSLDAVAAASRRKPAAHGLDTARQSSPLSVGENVTPTSHAAHVRSLVSVPSVTRPLPLAHVCHGMHAPRPLTGAYAAAGQAAHVRSLLGVAALSS